MGLTRAAMMPGKLESSGRSPSLPIVDAIIRGGESAFSIILRLVHNFADQRQFRAVDGND